MALHTLGVLFSMDGRDGIMNKRDMHFRAKVTSYDHKENTVD